MAVALITCRGRIWMNQRKETLLKSLWVYHLTENVENRQDMEKAIKALGIRASYKNELGKARHIFTHRVWNMTLYHYEAASTECREGRFVTLKEMNALPIPTAMKAAKEQAVRLLTPDIVKADEALLPETAAAYSASWKASHTAHCSAEFLERHSPAYMEAKLREHIAKRHDVYALRMTDKTVGALVIGKAENELISLYVQQEYQGTGIGKAATAFAVNALDKDRPMKVIVLTDNERAKKLYTAFGFIHITETRVLDAKQNLMECDLIRPPFAGEGEETK